MTELSEHTGVAAGEEAVRRVSGNLFLYTAISMAFGMTAVAVFQDGRFSAAVGAVAPYVVGIAIYKLRFECVVDLFADGMRVRYRGGTHALRYDEIQRVSGGWRGRWASMGNMGVRIHLRCPIEGLGDQFWFWPMQEPHDGERHPVAVDIERRMADARFSASLPAAADPLPPAVQD